MEYTCVTATRGWPNHVQDIVTRNCSSDEDDNHRADPYRKRQKLQSSFVFIKGSQQKKVRSMKLTLRQRSLMEMMSSLSERSRVRVWPNCVTDLRSSSSWPKNELDYQHHMHLANLISCVSVALNTKLWEKSAKCEQVSSIWRKCRGRGSKVVIPKATNTSLLKLC